MTLYELAENLLESIIQQAKTSGITLPDRRVIYMSPVPMDCEQVVVMFNGWTILDDTGDMTNCLNSPMVGGLSATITRKTKAVGTGAKAIPTAESMRDAAKIASDDAELFRDLLIGMNQFASPQIIAQSPTGGLQTVELDLTLSGI